jgi:hypothetical protein
VQAGRGRGHRTTFAGEDRLVALAIRLRIVAADVGRQGHVADAVEDGEEILHRLELQQALAELAALQHLGFKHDFAVWARERRGARRWRPSGPAGPGRARGFPRRSLLSVSASDSTQRLWDGFSVSITSMRPEWFLVVAEQCAAGVEARRNHAAVVEDQQVAGMEQRGKIGKVRVAQSSGRAIHHQHAALAALGGRLLRDQLRGQVEIEIGNAQAGLAGLADPHAFGSLK